MPAWVTIISTTYFLSYDATHDVLCLPWTSADPVFERMCTLSRGKLMNFHAVVPVFAVQYARGVERLAPRSFEAHALRVAFPQTGKKFFKDQRRAHQTPLSGRDRRHAIMTKIL